MSSRAETTRPRHVPSAYLARAARDAHAPWMRDIERGCSGNVRDGEWDAWFVDDDEPGKMEHPTDPRASELVRIMKLTLFAEAGLLLAALVACVAYAAS